MVINDVDEFVQMIEDSNHRERVIELLSWVQTNYPELQQEVKWNQPMFTHHGTFIIGFSVANQHISIVPEHKGIAQFEEAIQQAGYSRTKGLFRIKFSQSVDKELLKKIIDFNIEDKKDCDTFWRQQNGNPSRISVLL